MLLSLICLVITILTYCTSKAIYKKYSLVILSPLLVVPVILITLMAVNHISYTSYAGGAKWLTKLLGPATVAMAIPLHKHFDLLKKHAYEILTSLFVGASVAIVSSMLLSALLNFNHQTIISIAPRSVTTPIAIDISQIIGGVQTLTAVFVIITGLTGIIIGPLIIKTFRIHTTIAKGVLLGLGAHGCGISKALELGAEEGTIASLAMIVTAGLSLALVPLLVPFLANHI
ncbi:MAG TPA: LrgB family protein [Desulfobacteria bacterium]|nr:LrgB family protein [Desulfobacteria bacterium]